MLLLWSFRLRSTTRAITLLDTKNRLLFFEMTFTEYRSALHAPRSMPLVITVSRLPTSANASVGKRLPTGRQARNDNDSPNTDKPDTGCLLTTAYCLPALKCVSYNSFRIPSFKPVLLGEYTLSICAQLRILR